MTTKSATGIDSWFCTFPFQSYPDVLKMKAQLEKDYHEVKISKAENGWELRYRNRKLRK